nr:DUF1416 domain-containing protein [Actinomycetota bacterium]
LPAHVDLTKETVIYGKVVREGAEVPSAYVRLLDSGGDFTAEVVTSATGDFRFYAAPGRWTLSVLTRGAAGRKDVVALEPGQVEVTLPVG